MSRRLNSYVRTYRRLHALTQDELALLVGFKRGANISSLERGQRKPTTSILIALAHIFAVPLDDIFPARCQEIHFGVNKRAEALYEALQGVPGPVARAKLDLLETIIRRASSGTNQTEV